MKRRVMTAILTIGISLPVLADEHSSNGLYDVYYPRLADIMMWIQIRHFKLWHAGHSKNWTLADFELGQIRESFDETMRIFPNIPLADKYMIAEPMEKLNSAIEKKDSVQFSKAFDKLTAACNSCHKAANLGYIVIRQPRMSSIETLPFSDEAFSHR